MIRRVALSGPVRDTRPYHAIPFRESQEPLNGPFLNGLFSRGFSRGKTAHLRHSEKRPIKVGKRPIKEGKRPPHQG